MTKDIYSKIHEAFVKAFPKKEKKERTWCCFTLSESEIIRAIDENVSLRLKMDLDKSPELREEFTVYVVDRFRGAVAEMALEWEHELSNCVLDTAEQWKDIGEQTHDL